MTIDKLYHYQLQLGDIIGHRQHAWKDDWTSQDSDRMLSQGVIQAVSLFLEQYDSPIVSQLRFTNGYTTVGFTLTRPRRLIWTNGRLVSSTQHKPYDLSTTIVPSCRQYPHSEDATCNVINYRQGLIAVRHCLHALWIVEMEISPLETVIKTWMTHTVHLLEDRLSVLHVELHICMSFWIWWNLQWTVISKVTRPFYCSFTTHC